MFEELIWPVLRRTGGFVFWIIIEALPWYWGSWKETVYPPLHNNEDKLSLTERARLRRDRWMHDSRTPN